ncbi:Agrin Agrin N-terminal 110 kDa subunit [Triplophysa tibetana]|uniref:Agrin Agrin N-terminal 110 kDa subunit n=1 Tax=Triplophysa tibetana TaxID=1572043 RepID=A0A5A9NAT5_9TELE|nr:Agrin Agrin N-terminal 110 kDa subunit [Triplophysa tibetana]
MTSCQYPTPPPERDRMYQHKVSLVVRYFMIPCNICLILLATSTLGFAVLLFLNNYKPVHFTETVPPDGGLRDLFQLLSCIVSQHARASSHERSFFLRLCPWSDLPELLQPEYCISARIEFAAPEINEPIREAHLAGLVRQLNFGWRIEDSRSLLTETLSLDLYQYFSHTLRRGEMTAGDSDEIEASVVEASGRGGGCSLGWAWLRAAPRLAPCVNLGPRTGVSPFTLSRRSNAVQPQVASYSFNKCQHAPPAAVRGRESRGRNMICFRETYGENDLTVEEERGSVFVCLILR